MIWNVVESGFELSPKTGKFEIHVSCMESLKIQKILSPHFMLLRQNVQYVMLIMHIFQEWDFKSNPLEGSVGNAYMGRLLAMFIWGDCWQCLYGEAVERRAFQSTQDVFGEGLWKYKIENSSNPFTKYGFVKVFN